MLAPMSLANPARAWRFALLTTLTSVAGGLFGYAIGYFAFDAIEPWLRESKYWDSYQLAVAWFDNTLYLMETLMTQTLTERYAEPSADPELALSDTGVAGHLPHVARRGRAALRAAGA